MRGAFRGGGGGGGSGGGGIRRTELSPSVEMQKTGK